MKRRKFTQEFKEEAVLLVKQSGVSVSEIARNLGLNDNVLRRWIKEYAEPGTKAFPGHGNARDEELSRLKKNCYKLRRNGIF
jgi:transposase